MADPRVDIIIPCYNTAKYLGQAIDSALEQTYPFVNVLVVDDGSTDNTRKVAASYQGRVGYHYQENKGLGSARNAGFHRTEGEYVCFLDADDAILPHMVADQLAIFERRPETGICHGKTLVFNRNCIEYPVAESFRPAREWDDYVEPLSFICAFHLGSAVIRRETVVQFGPFDENSEEQGCEDWAFELRAAVGGTAFSHIPRVHGLYRQHTDSMSADESMIVRREAAMLKYAAGLLEERGVLSGSRRRTLSLGLASGAIRARRNKNSDIELTLTQLSRMTDTDPRPGNKRHIDAITDSDCPPSVSYLALSAELLELEKDDLAAVMFIKCGDLAICEEESIRHGCGRLFRDVKERMSRIAHREADEVSDEWEAPDTAMGPKPGKDFFHKLEGIMPHHASFRSYILDALGRYEKAHRDYKKAEEEFCAAIKLNPNDSPSRFALGICLLNQRLFRTAIEQLEVSRIADPRLPPERFATKARDALAAVLGSKGERFDDLRSPNGLFFKTISYVLDLLLPTMRRLFPVTTPGKKSGAEQS